MLHLHPMSRPRRCLSKQACLRYSHGHRPSFLLALFCSSNSRALEIFFLEYASHPTQGPLSSAPLADSSGTESLFLGHDFASSIFEPSDPGETSNSSYVGSFLIRSCRRQGFLGGIGGGGPSTFSYSSSTLFSHSFTLIGVVRLEERWSLTVFRCKGFSSVATGSSSS